MVQIQNKNYDEWMVQKHEKGKTKSMIIFIVKLLKILLLLTEKNIIIRHIFNMRSDVPTTVIWDIQKPETDSACYYSF